MSDSEEIREERASTAAADEIETFLHDPSPRVIKALLANKGLQEEDVLIITTRKNLPGDILEAVAKERRWADSYPIRLALAKNPKTPLFTALSIVRYLRLFDQAEVLRSPALPLIFRQKVEAILIEKVPTMALGVKKTLAKIASGNVLLALIRDGYPEIVAICLNNPHLIEANLFKIINRENTGPATVRQIANHPNWSSRYLIRFSLVRNRRTPLARAVLFISGLKTRDLKELYIDPSLPADIKPCIHRELLERGENMDRVQSGRLQDEEQIYEFEEQEADELEREIERFEQSDDDHLHDASG